MIKIKLTAEKGSSKGVNYNKYIADYFDDFVTGGWPYILGGSDTYQGDQILLLDELAKKPANTKAMILDGQDIFYYFTGHTLSGELNKVTLATLGKSYVAKDGSFKTDKKGHIKNTSDKVEISGLDISNPEGVRGAFHDVVYALMGGAHEGGGKSDPSLLISYVNGEAQKLVGSKKGDAYTGTAYDDNVNGKNGNDKLDGALGNDTIKGGKGKDKFVFRSDLGPDNIDTIKDFAVGKDKMLLSRSAFDGLSKGGLDDSAFVVGSAAEKSSDRIVYNDKTGALSFDVDGAGGAAAVQFAQLGEGLKLDAGDFLVI